MSGSPAPVPPRDPHPGASGDEPGRAVLRVLQVGTSDVAGGAERIAADLHRAYLARGLDSWVAVGHKRGDDTRVLEIEGVRRSRWGDALAERGEATDGRHRRLGDVGRLAPRALLAASEPRRYARILRGVELLPYPGTASLLDLPPFAPDVLHLHNLHGYYFDLRALPALSSRVPTILTLHDAWLLTGHCAHPMDCPRWAQGCGECPSLDAYVPIRRDASRRNRAIKADIVRRSAVRIATPSAWLMRMVEASGIARDVLEARVVPNGVDTRVFTPGDKAEARDTLGIAQDSEVVLFAAQNASTSPYKDYETLRQALPSVAERRGGRLVLVMLGEADAAVHVEGTRTLAVPFVHDAQRLALYYRAADLLLHPARAESFGLTVAEAMACGTPVVATRVGGIPEIVVDGTTGTLVEAGDASALAAATAGLLDDADRARAFSEEGVRRARDRFSLERMADDYIDWYREIADARSAAGRRAER